MEIVLYEVEMTNLQIFVVRIVTQTTTDKDKVGLFDWDTNKVRIEAWLKSCGCSEIAADIIATTILESAAEKRCALIEAMATGVSSPFEDEGAGIGLTVCFD